MMDDDHNIRKMIEYPKKGVLSKRVVSEGIVDCTLFCMAEGTEISDHTSTKQGIVYVIEGDGIFTLAGKEIRMEEGVCISMEKHAVLSLRAKENTSFLLVLAGQ